MNKAAKFINDLSRKAFNDANEHALYDEGPSFPEMCAHVHAEVSEAYEEWNHECPENTHKRMVAKELADVVILVMSMSVYFDLDLGNALVEKMEENIGRPYKHMEE